MADLYTTAQKPLLRRTVSSEIGVWVVCGGLYPAPLSQCPKKCQNSKIYAPPPLMTKPPSGYGLLEGLFYVVRWFRHEAFSLSLCHRWPLPLTLPRFFHQPSFSLCVFRLMCSH